MDSLDKLTIQTPEQIALEYPLAGLGSRALAIVFDSLLVFVISLVTLLGVVFIFSGMHIEPRRGMWVGAALLLAGFLVYWGYFAFFETIWNGQTPGKRQAKIRVIKDTGRPITAYEAITRNLLRFVDQFPGMYAVGMVSMLASPQNKRLGDYVAGTVVVHEAVTAGHPVVDAPTAVGAPALANVRQLSDGDLELIETFLQRRYELSTEVRQQTAGRIAQHLAMKLGAGPAAGQSVEDYLESVARSVRGMGRYK